MSEKEIIAKLIDRAPIALVVIGAVLLIIAAAGGWNNPSFQISEPIWRIIVGAVAIAIVALGGILGWREKTHDAISSELPNRYGIKIISPQEGASVGKWSTVSGTYALKPAGRVQLFTVSPDKHNYWPQDVVQYDLAKKTWSGTVYVGGAPQQITTIVVAIVGKCGQILCDYYAKVGQETGQWPSLERLPDDVVECDRIWVRKAQ